MKAVVYLILLAHFASAEVGGETEGPESVCKHLAYSQALECIKYGHNGSDDHVNCLSDVVLNYVLCAEPSGVVHIGDTSLEGKIKTTIRKHYGHISIENIKCIITNILDLLRCITDEELKPGVTFKWDWMALLKCVLLNIPKYAACIPKIG